MVAGPVDRIEMSEIDSDERKRIRERKREEILDEDGEGGGSGAETPDEPVHVESQSDLQDAVAEYDVALADFYADWCGPCKMLEPIVADLAAETDAAVLKVDVDRHQQLAAQYQVQGVPTMVLFGDGEAVERIVGVRDKDSLADLIESYRSD
jgi:thioredoxin 1